MNCSRSHTDHHTLFHKSSKYHGVSTPRLLRVSHNAITLSISSIVVSLLSLRGKYGDISLLRFVILMYLITTFTLLFARFLFVHMHYKSITKPFPNAHHPRKLAIICAPSRSHERYQQDCPVTSHSLLFLTHTSS